MIIFKRDCDYHQFYVLVLSIAFPFFAELGIVLVVRENEQSFARSKSYSGSRFSGYYLIKPYYEAELYNKLCTILGIETMEERENLVGRVERKEGNKGFFDIFELEKTANGDNEFFTLVLNNFVNNAEGLLERFTAGLRAQNFEEIGEAAHKALSSFRFFKLDKQVEKLEEIEKQTLRIRNFRDVPDLVEQTVAEIEEILDMVRTNYLKA